jgi:hypothetical protein
MNVQVTEEAFSSQKRPSNTLKHELLLFWVIIALLDPDPDPLSRLNPDPIRIHRIHMFLGLPNPIVRGMDPDPSIIMQK